MLFITENKLHVLSVMKLKKKEDLSTYGLGLYLPITNHHHLRKCVTTVI